MTDVLTDETARHAVAGALDDTLFVSAGAGSGKTTALVGRVEALVVAGVPLDAVAAITFTEKAAAELRDRLRSRLEHRAVEAASAAESDRCRAALDALDGAAISTLHAFAQRLLSEHPIEAGLPPGVEVLDEIGSDIEFDERWRRFVDELLDDPAFERSLLVADAAGVRIDHLRDIARAFEQNWDLVAERVPAAADPPKLSGAGAVAAELIALDDLRQFCDDPDNKLCEAITQLVEVGADAAALAEADPVQALVSLLGGPDRRYGRCGAKTAWNHPDHPIDAVRDAVTEVNEHRQRWCQTAVEAAVAQLASAIGQFTLAEAERRRTEGRLGFHDLLVLARRMLRDPDHGAGVRRAAGERYRRLLLDEFQDTDPIQIELAVLLAAPPQPGDDRLAWFELTPAPGRLFFVGDPKQSIYRFRRADIRLYLDAAERFGDPVQSLTTNFRSSAAVLDWVNAVFAQLIEPTPGSQPHYEPLVAHRSDEPGGPAVTLLGVDEAPESTRASDLRHREAADVAAVVEAALADGWEVSERHGDEVRHRPARLGDICILLPARTSLPQLERALDARAIPYRAEASGLLYGSQEVRDLLAVLRAVDDPTEELALVTALRSPAFGCGDDDLYEFRSAGGHWSHQRPAPEPLPPDHPVVEAMGWLAKLHDARTWLTPSEIVDRILRERGLFELGFVQGRFRDIWRRYRFVVDQARAFADSVGGSLRDYLRWVERLAAEGSRVAETVLPESDDDAVRILTVHAAKGLEFPITIVSGTTTRMAGRRRGIQVVFPPDSDTYGLAITKDVVTDEFELHQPLDEQMDHHERLRLLYVACTRAVDHLVVSCHRAARAKPPSSPDKMTAAEVLHGAASATTWAPPPLPAPPVGSPPPAVVAGGPPERSRWAAERDEAITRAGRARVTSATAVARVAAEAVDAAMAKEPRDLDLPPWRRGRYGTAVGRAVHGVLQAVDLTGDPTLDAVAAAQAAAEGVDDRADVVAGLARSALQSPVVVEAAAATYWREVYVAAPVGDTLLEGYVDLVFERGDGLVVVDYKTDHVASPADLDAKLDRYRLQLGAYALALRSATGRAVVDARFVFCDLDGAHERSAGAVDAIIDGAAASVESARALVSADVELD